MCSLPSAVLCCMGCTYAQVTVSHLSLLCREQMALWRHRDDEQPVAGNVSCGLTPGQLQRAVTQLAHLQIFRSYYPLHHYNRQNGTQDKTELAIHGAPLLPDILPISQYFALF